MEIAGIVCEYNPFHNGHAFHIRKSRELLGEDGAVLCVMSGDFVQRGEAACYSKFARAEAACRSGADLVVELPLPWSLSSAEGFARGAVGLLGALGATKLCFGSESGELAPLDALAQSLLQPGLINEIKVRLSGDGNLSFAAARELAVRARLGAAADLLRQPNDILAVEYLKAVYELRLDLEPVPILRQDCAHDQSGGPGLRSASEIRKRIAAGKALDQDMPLSALSVLMKERELGREIARSMRPPSSPGCACLTRRTSIGSPARRTGSETGCSAPSGRRPGTTPSWPPPRRSVSPCPASAVWRCAPASA